MSSNIPIIFKWYLNRQGIQGLQGVQGEEGFSPTITVDEDTLTNYTLRVQNKNGSFVTPNLRQTVQDNGGTYIRYDRNTGKMFAGFADGATDSQVGVVRLATPQDVIDGAEDAVITPANLVDYLTDTYQLPIASTTTLGGIKVGDGLSITNDGVLSASGGGREIQLKNASDLYEGVKISPGAGPGIHIGGWNSAIILGSGWNAGKESWAAPYIDFSTEYANESYTHNYYGRITGFNDGILFSPGNMSCLQNTTSQYYVGVVKISTASGETETEGAKSITLETRHILGYVAEGAEYETVDSQTVLTDKTGIQYQALTSTQYTELQTKSDSTIYKLTDTNEVYLGTIELTGGGANIAAAMFAGTLTGGQNTGYVGTNTVSTYDPPTT